MTPTEVSAMPPTPESSLVSRPVGVVQPESDRARRAQKALTENRLDDARQNLDALADAESLEGAWKAVLSGRLSLAGKDFAEAAARFRRAVATYVIVSASPEAPDAARIAALALEELGAIQRRQDRPRDAFQSHLASLRLREQHGSLEELCECAIHLGIDLEVARQFADAEAWYRRAIELAHRSTIDPRGREALAWQRLAHCLSLAGRHLDAMAAARAARSAWQLHDVGSLDATRAELHLGRVLLKFGESLFDADADRARSILDEAAETLATAADGLRAFGPPAASEAESAAQQADFARRLHASLSVGSPSAGKRSANIVCGSIAIDASGRPD